MKHPFMPSQLKVVKFFVAGPMGLEPTASGVTGRRYNQLNYDPAELLVLVGGTGLEPVTLGL